MKLGPLITVLTSGGVFLHHSDCILTNLSNNISLCRFVSVRENQWKGGKPSAYLSVTVQAPLSFQLHGCKDGMRMRMWSHFEHQITSLPVCMSLSLTLPPESWVYFVLVASENPFIRALHLAELQRLAISILRGSACLTVPDKVKIYSQTKWGAIPHTSAYSISFCALYTGPVI